MKVFKIKWQNISNDLPPKNYKCGCCNHPISSEKGFKGHVPGQSSIIHYIYICYNCSAPTMFYDGKQLPGSKLGIQINHIKDVEIEKLYDEADSCYSVGSYTASIMCCRKLLMSIAVANGAAEKKNFITYVNYLNKEGYIPPNGRAWVDSIRKLGNEANHEIKLRTEAEASLMIKFIEMLLRFIYEMPGLLELNYPGKGNDDD